MSADTSKILFIIVVLFANIVEGITGFAGTMLAMPASMMLLGVNEAKSILNMVALMVSSTIAIRTYKEINRKELLKITVLMVIGMAAGLYLFSVLPVAGLSKLYGLLIMAVAVKGLFIKTKLTMPGALLLLIVLAAGVVHGLFLSGGSLLVIYAVAVLKDKGVIRATLAPVWLILNSMILVQDLVCHRITTEVLSLTGACILPVIAALIAGNYLHKKMRQELFVKLTYLLLIVSGVTLLIGS